MTMDEPLVSRVERIIKDPLAGGAEEAYKELRHGFLEDNQGKSQNEVASAWRNLTSQLQEKGLLPDLAVGFAAANFAEIDKDGDGLINRSELRNIEGMNRTFAAELLAGQGKKDVFHSIARLSDADGVQRKFIEREDLDMYLGKHEKRISRSRLNTNARESMRPLFAGEEPLIQHLDRNTNGRISRNELKSFLSDYRKHQGSGPYTAENAEYVKRIMDGHNNEFEKSFLGMSGFSVDKLARKGGFDAVEINSRDDYAKLKSNFETADGTSKSGIASESPDEGREIIADGPEPSADEVEPFAHEVEPSADGIEPALPDEHKWGPPGDPPPGQEGDAPSDTLVTCEGLDVLQNGLKQLLTVRKGEGYWHVAKRLLESGVVTGVPQENPDNKSVFQLMNFLMHQNGANFNGNSNGKADYKPVLHPGDVVFFDPSHL